MSLQGFRRFALFKLFAIAFRNYAHRLRQGFDEPIRYGRSGCSVEGSEV
jgi:hypothetical protein